MQVKNSIGTTTTPKTMCTFKCLLKSLDTALDLACVSGCLQLNSIILHDALMWFDRRSVRLCGLSWKVDVMGHQLRMFFFFLIHSPLSFSLFRLSGRLSKLPVVMNNDHMTGLASREWWQWGCELNTFCDYLIAHNARYTRTRQPHCLL